MIGAFRVTGTATKESWASKENDLIQRQEFGWKGARLGRWRIRPSTLPSKDPPAPRPLNPKSMSFLFKPGAAVGVGAIRRPHGRCSDRVMRCHAPLMRSMTWQWMSLEAENVEHRRVLHIFERW
jgi:hypothetical protein